MTDGNENRASILIVDDEPFFRQVIVDILNAEQLLTLEAASGAEVTALLGRHDIGLVLTDIEMPDVSGLEVLSQVKALKPDIPVVIISGHQDFFAVREVLSGGALDYLVKPFTDEELLSVVRRGLADYQTKLVARRQSEEAERLLADLVLLREVGETVSGEVDLDTLLNRIVDLTVDAVNVQTASLMLPARDGNLRIRAAHGLPDGVRERAVIKPGEGLSGHVYQTGEPVLLADILEDGRFSPSGDKGQYTTSSALSLPLKGRDRILGVLNVNNKLDGQSFSATDQHLLASIAHQSALAIENFNLVKQLRDKAIELESLNNARSRLVCNLSHELKTPLTTVLGFSDLLQTHRAQIAEAELDDYLQKITDSSLQMEKLISGMLLLFSIDSGSAQWVPQPLSVGAMCLAAAELYRSPIEKLELNLELEIADDLPLLYADTEKTRLLIEALIDNAIKFNEPGGRLNILVEPRNANGVDKIYLRVHNDGIHVPIEAAHEIFAQYSQLGEINTAKPEGVGIGLALCRTIVEKIGGSIFLEETGGIGTSFGVILPVRPDQEELIQ